MPTAAIMRDMTHSSYWCDAHGLRVHARVAAPHEQGAIGEVVLVHGLGVSSRYMVPLLEQLGATTRCWAPDLPGHGRSQDPGRAYRLPELVDLLDAWLDAAHVERPLLVGNSYGCQLAAELARSRDVAGLVLVGPTMERERRSLARHVLRLAADQVFEPAALTALQAGDYVETGFRRTMREFRDSQNHDLIATLREIDAPTIVARGSRDTIARRDWCERVAAAASAPLHEVPGRGHCINTTAPRRIAQLSLELLAAAALATEPFANPATT
ncbi:MAG: Hydrolase, alpha/beta hydrolase fold family [Thermoleophilia bacterium]|nr:Hydrolase, alpha/beta hydrolase fold family [Thermoleophilia bacterium]